MPEAPLPHDETLRLLDLSHHHILDTPPEETYDRITRLAARTLRTPVAVINFIDQTRQYGKSCHGVPDTTAPRAHSFCAWTILTPDTLIIPDTTQDDRFQGNPFTHGDTGVRFYAGVPLTTPAGHRIGTLCVTDNTPRTFTEEDQAVLKDLGALVEQELRWRTTTHELTKTIKDQHQEALHLQQHLAHAQTLEAINALQNLALTAEGLALRATALISTAIHADWAALLITYGDTHTYQLVRTHPDITPALLTYLEHRTKSIGPLAKIALQRPQPTYVDTYHKHPQALRGAADLGVTGVVHLPLGEHDGNTYLLTALRTGRPTTTPWRAADRALIDAAGRNVTAALARKAQHTHAQHTARQDSLTRIPNCRAFDETLKQYIHADQPFTLAAIDLDRFKSVRDNEGHTTGDQVLSAFARTLHTALASTGQVFRIGGNEFMLLLQPDVDDNTLQRSIDQAVLAARSFTSVPLGVSLATLPVESPDHNAQAIMNHVDALLYKHKRQRKMLH